MKKTDNPLENLCRLVERAGNIQIKQAGVRPEVTPIQKLKRLVTLASNIKLLKEKKPSRFPTPIDRYITTCQNYNVNLVKPEAKDYKVKNTIVLDWWEAMITGRLVEFDTPLERYDYDLKRIEIIKDKKGGTEFFKCRYQIYIDGKKFAYILCETRHPNLVKKDTIQMKLYNNVLYEADWNDRLKYLFKKLNWTVSNMTEIDIALDGYGFTDIYKKYLNGSLEKVGRKNLKHSPEYEGRSITGFNWGGKKKWHKRMTGYDKSLRIPIEGKFYIEDFWKRTGLHRETMDPVKAMNNWEYASRFDKNGLQIVERMELKIKNQEIKKIIDFNWELLDNFEYLASLYRTCTKGYFDFFIKGKDSNVTRSNRIEICDWSSLGAILLPKDSTITTNRIWSFKNSCKNLTFIYLATGRKHFRDIAIEMATNINHLRWYGENCGKWEEDFKILGEKYADKFGYLLHYIEYAPGEQFKFFALK